MSERFERFLNGAETADDWAYQRAHDVAVDIVKQYVPGADAFAFAVAHRIVERTLELYDEEFGLPDSCTVCGGSGFVSSLRQPEFPDPCPECALSKPQDDEDFGEST